MGKRVSKKIVSRVVLAKDRYRAVKQVSRLRFLLPLTLLIFFLSIILFSTEVLNRIDRYRDIEFTSAFDYPEPPTDEISSTVIVMENPESEGEVAYVSQYIWNHELGKGILITIPRWLYFVPSVEIGESHISTGNLIYVSEDLLSNHRYVIDEVSNITGISVDSYVWLGADSLNLYDEAFSTNLNAVKSGSELIDYYGSFSFTRLVALNPEDGVLSASVESDLTPIELFDLFKSIGNADRADLLTLIDVGEDWATNPATLDSGVGIVAVNYEMVDKEVSKNVDILRAREVEREQAKFEVFNGSDVGGLASRISRKLENNGVRVVRSGNAPAPVERSLVYVSNVSHYSNSLALLESVLGTDSYDVIEGRPDFLTTGDIVVILGSNYALMFEDILLK